MAVRHVDCRVAAALAATLGGRAKVYRTPAAARLPLEQALRLFHPTALAHWLGADGSALQSLVGRDETHRPAPVVVDGSGCPEANAAGLRHLIEASLSELEAVVQQSGAILFRGWELKDLQDFDGALRSLKSRPTDFFGTAPRCRLAGSDYLFRNVAFETAAAGGGPAADTHAGEETFRVEVDEVQRVIERVIADGRSAEFALLASMVTELEQERGGLDEELKLKLNAVFAGTTMASKSHPQLFNYHNELAYLTPELHSAPYGTFACLQAPELGGATLLADCRRVLETLKESLGEGLPTHFRYIIARKPHDGVSIPRKSKGGYEGFLTGEYELDGVVDQWYADETATGEAALRSRAASLGLEVVDQGHDLAVYSPWVPTHRPCALGNEKEEETWWLNGNHMTLGATGHPQLPFEFRFADGTERAPTLAEATTIATAYWRESSFFPWVQGDLLIFSNQLVAHNASPGVGARQILPSFGDMF